MPGMDARLQCYADAISRLHWAAMLLDAEDRIVWLSEDFKHFVRETDDKALGIGLHAGVALLREPYLATMTPESVLELAETMLPYFVHSLPVDELGPDVPNGFEEILRGIEPRVPPEHWTGTFDYVQPGVSPYAVHFLVSRIRDDSGQSIGQSVLTTIGLPAPLVALLAAGDAAMYERMVRLVEPGRHQAAILFADVQGSGELSRRLPTASYFQLVRALTAEFDRLVGAHCGVVGKHAGDGMTAFFLADDAGSPAAAAASVLRAARELQANAVAIAETVVAAADIPVLVNVGAHWGSGLYMGQLVPGGRLEVTALGDEVNEAARLQETARDGALLVSKALVELLDPGTATELGVPESLIYRPLSELPDAAPKAVRDAGHVAVAAL
ncbi:MAG: cyaB [Frankiales bacterium]|nr:cyaB [Frankiales bacterium]